MEETNKIEGEADKTDTTTTTTTTATSTSEYISSSTPSTPPPPPPPVVTTTKEKKIKEEFYKISILGELKNQEDEKSIKNNIIFLSEKPVVYVPFTIQFKNNISLKKKNLIECKWTINDQDVTSKLNITEKSISYTPTKDQSNMDLKISMKFIPKITNDGGSGDSSNSGNFITKLFKHSSTSSSSQSITISIEYNHKILYENPREILRINETNNKNNQFKLITFNILADLYISENYYSYLPAYALKWNTYRSHLLIPQILQYDADIMCMQEVDTMYIQLFQELNNKGYQHFPEYVDSKSNQPHQLKYREGCFIFFKKNRFNLIKGLEIDYRTIEQGKLIENDILSKLLVDPIFKLVITEHLESSYHHVRHCLVLVEDKITKEKIIFVSIHLYWGSHAVYQIQCVQIHLFSLILKKFIKDNKLDLNIPLIVCGDFNSSPDGSVYKYLTTGSMSNDDPNLTCNGQYTRTIKDTPNIFKNDKEENSNSDNSDNNDINSISHPFKLTSAYSLRPDGECKFTTVSKVFCGNIDQMYVSDRFKVNTVLEVGEKKDYKILPSLVLASDHILLMSELELKQ